MVPVLVSVVQVLPSALSSIRYLVAHGELFFAVILTEPSACFAKVGLFAAAGVV